MNIKCSFVKLLMVIALLVWYSYGEVIVRRGVSWPNVFLGEKMKVGRNC